MAFDGALFMAPQSDDPLAATVKRVIVLAALDGKLDPDAAERLIAELGLVGE
jgi:hypothetical protein